MAHLEPKVFILPNLSAGLRFEGDALFGGSISDAESDLEVGVSSRAAILLLDDNGNPAKVILYHGGITIEFDDFRIYDDGDEGSADYRATWRRA